MSVKTKPKRALRAIDDAKSNLERARRNTEDTQDIHEAIGELDDAESEIKRAIRGLPEE